MSDGRGFHSNRTCIVWDIIGRLLCQCNVGIIGSSTRQSSNQLQYCTVHMSTCFSNIQWAIKLITKCVDNVYVVMCACIQTCTVSACAAAYILYMYMYLDYNTVRCRFLSIPIMQWSWVAYLYQAEALVFSLVAICRELSRFVTPCACELWISLMSLTNPYTWGVVNFVLILILAHLKRYMCLTCIYICMVHCMSKVRWQTLFHRLLVITNVWTLLKFWLV